MTTRKIEPKEFTIRITVEPDPDLPNNFTDNADLEAEVHRRLNSNDPWAWCQIKVEVAAAGFTGVDYLGGVILSEHGDRDTEIRENAAIREMAGNAIRDLETQIGEEGWDAELDHTGVGDDLSAVLVETS